MAAEPRKPQRFLALLLWSFPARSHESPEHPAVVPCYSLKENRECDGIAVKEGHHQSLRRCNSPNGDRLKIRDEARRARPGQPSPGLPPALRKVCTTKDHENRQHRRGQGHTRLTNKRLLGDRSGNSRSSILMHEVEAVPVIKRGHCETMRSIQSA